MRSKIRRIIISQLILIIIFLTFSCKKENSQTGWVASYQNISLGDQDNINLGNFFKPQTGQSIPLESTTGQQPYLAMIFASIQGGANSYFTFPGDGSGLVNTSTNQLYAQTNVGINYWLAQNLVTGMIYLSSMTSLDYDNLVAKKSWDQFDKTFSLQNGNEPNLSYKLHYDLNPDAGNVYLVQLNGLIRAIICIRGVVNSSANGGSILFDALVEGHDKYANSSSAKYIMPAKR